MKLLVLFTFILGVGLVTSKPQGANYLMKIGVPLAARIKAAEEAKDFDGSRILGGSPAALGQYPYIGGIVITLSTGFTAVCGSSLLTNTRLVTAAHCWYDGWSQARQFLVVLGSLTLFAGGTRFRGCDSRAGSFLMQRLSIAVQRGNAASVMGTFASGMTRGGLFDLLTTTEVFPHPSWNPSTASHDIAVINVPTVIYTEIVRNIPLPSGSLVTNAFVGSMVRAAGWGLQNDTAIISSGQLLHHVTLQVVTNSLCQSLFGSVAVSSNTLCVSGSSGRSTCSGDSGGPLVVSSGGRDVLIGVGSFRHQDGCSMGYPTGFTRVASYIPWINERLYS